MPRIFNLKTDIIPAGSLRIDRPTPYGNRFVIGRHGTREEVIDKFVKYQLPKLNVEPLRGFHLVCWCRPKPCHGQPIMKKLYGADFVCEGFD